MPKHIYCAQCGIEVLRFMKALPKQGKVIEVVEPHNCKEFDECEFYPLAGEEVCSASTNGNITIFEDCTIKFSETCEAAIKARKEKPELIPIKKKNPERLTKLFDSFKFVQKLNKLNPKNDLTEVGDQRSSDSLRKEIQTSTAPTGLVDFVKAGANGHDSGDEIEPEEA